MSIQQRQSGSFRGWMDEVDREISKVFADMGHLDCPYRDGGWSPHADMGHLDLPDCPYRDWYDGGWSPKAAADECLKRAGFRISKTSRCTSCGRVAGSLHYE